MANAVAITTPVQYTVAQRTTATTGSLAITGTYTYTGTGHLEAKLGSGSFSRIATVTTGTGAAYSGSLSVTAGPRATLTVRFEEDTATSATRANVAVGENVLVIGDSRTSPLYTNADSYTQTSIGCSQLSNDGATWYDSNDAVNAKRNTWVIRYCDLLCQQLNMAVGCSIQNAGGTDIGSSDRWSTTSLDLWTTVLARIGSFSWGHVQMEFGPNGFAYHLTEAQYTTLFGLQTAFIAANVPGAPTKVFWQLCGEAANEGTASWKTNYRNAILDHVALGLGGYVGANIIDQEYSESDHIHPESDAHRVQIGNRASLSVQGIVAGTGASARGPRPSAISQSTSNVDVQFNQTLGNSISASLTTSAWSVTDSGSPVTVNSVTVTDNRTVRLALASTPTTPLVSLAAGDTAVLATLPVSANKTLADSTTIQIPAEPINALGVFTTAQSGVSRSRVMAGM